MRLAFVYTGGTIGSLGVPLAPISPEAFRDRWLSDLSPDLPGDLELVPVPFAPALDSSQAEPADWTRIARAVLEGAAAAPDAVLVLHGTDTMSASAAALSYLTTLLDAEGVPVGRLAVPVIVTGSMRPIFADAGGIRPGTDAVANVRAALAAAPGLGPGVHLVSAGEVLQGARTLKVTTEADRAFSCPNGPVALPALPAAAPEALLAQLDGLADELGRRAVIAIGPSPNPHSVLGAALAGAVSALEHRLGAIQLLGYGTGNLPASTQLGPILRAARARGVMVAIGSQVMSGRVAFETYGAGAWLAEAGVVSCRDMTVPAAQAKLHLAVALAASRGWDLREAEAFFARPIAGEMAAG